MSTMTGRRIDPRRRWRGGQVLVILLLAMTLLAGLVFYVYNVGHHVNRGVDVQNAADAAAVSAATWLARSMNIVAMNNVASVRVLNMVPILDAIPQAADISLREATAWEKGLADQIGRGVPTSYLADGLESLRERMEWQRDVLAEIDAKLGLNASTPMSSFTMWDASEDGLGGTLPHGQIWKTALMLQDFSEATVAGAGLLAQGAAVRFGETNDMDAAFVAPVIPIVPAMHGEWSDFQPPLQGKLFVDNDGATAQNSGGKGGAVPDAEYPHRLGPWARLFEWRDYKQRVFGRREELPPAAPRRAIKVRSGSGNVSIGGRRVGSSAIQTGRGASSGRRWRWIREGSEVYGYEAYGPYNWAWRGRHKGIDIAEFAREHIVDVTFDDRWRDLSDDKLGYMFNPPGQLKQIHDPDWYTDYPTCKEMAEETLQVEQPDGTMVERKKYDVNRTMFYLVEIVSSVPESSPGWLRGGTYRTNGDEPIAIWVGGWEDPAEWEDDGVQRAGSYVWKDAFTYETTEDPEIGIHYNPANPDDFRTVYVVQWYVFGGIDVGEKKDVRNPFNWASNNDPPVPIVFDDAARANYTPHPDFVSEFGEELGTDPGTRRVDFALLGVARLEAYAPIWPSRFSNANPLDSIVKIAQAKVLNNRSWDLWTQDWQAQLTRVRGWGQWVDRLHDGAAEAQYTGGLVAPEEVERIRDYMWNLGERMAEDYLTH
jgi:hypothetical protein